MRVLLLAAMPFEIAPFRRMEWPKHLQVQFAVTGIGPKAALYQIKSLMTHHQPDWIVGVGVCGALDGEYRPGDIAIPLEFVSDEGSVLLKAGLHKSYETSGRMLSVRRVAATPISKRILQEAYTAHWVDQESYSWALAASDVGVPFLAIRSVLDTAEDYLPDWRQPFSWRHAVKLPLRVWMAQKNLANVGRQWICGLS